MKTTTLLLTIPILLGTCLTISGSNKRKEQQQVKDEVSGVITDYFKETIIGATVVNKTKNVYTYSDINGHYSIPASPGDTLIFNYIGYMENIVCVQNEKNLNITIISGRYVDSYPKGSQNVYDPTLQLIFQGLQEKPVGRYTVLPSWDKPHSLSLEKRGKDTYILLSKTLPDYAPRQNAAPSIKRLTQEDVSTDSIVIDKKLYSMIETLFSETVPKMSKIRSEGLDGATYYLSTTDKNGQVIVRSFWTPEQGSIPDKLIQLLDKLYIVVLDKKIPSTLEKEILQMISKIRKWDSHPDKVPPQR